MEKKINFYNALTYLALRFLDQIQDLVCFLKIFGAAVSEDKNGGMWIRAEKSFFDTANGHLWTISTALHKNVRDVAIESGDLAGYQRLRYICGEERFWWGNATFWRKLYCKYTARSLALFVLDWKELMWSCFKFL